MKEKVYFIGYGELESVLDTHPKDEPLFLTLIEEPGKYGQFGTSLNKFVLVAGDFRNGIARYCRVVLGNAQMLNGEPWDKEQYKKTKGISRFAYDMVKDVLLERGFLLEEALIAIPKDLRLFEGSIGFLRWDKGLQNFSIAKESEAA